MLCFTKDLTSTKTAKLLNLNRRIVDRYFSIFRDKIFEFSKTEKLNGKGIFECDESYFGAERIRGKRGRGTVGKMPVFGLLKRDGKVYVTIVRNCSKKQLTPIIQGKVLQGSTINKDGWRSYDGLILNGYTHHRVYHSKDEFARGKCHVSRIESFWSFTKRRLAKYNGIASHKITQIFEIK
ncbi:MAG: IS1595 family transposase [Candidatus Moranbacteria bacterium]|nr:IS1595 family transposase [Candidatus Moranbacteria bacterium]